jgi:hypothetical protein
MQSKRWSIIEAMSNNIIGYIIAVVMYKLVLPIFGYNVSWSQSNVIVIVFTIISIIRSYLIRRIFNYINTKRTLL